MDEQQLNPTVPAVDPAGAVPTDSSATEAAASASVQEEPVAEIISPAAEKALTKDEPVSTDTAVNEVNKTKICLKALKAIERDLLNVIRLMETNVGALSPAEVAENGNNGENLPVVPAPRDLELVGYRQPEGRVIEGVFDGQNMVGSDGKIYTVPANYASKSKLVEGDLLKLTITPKGSFIYKQIGPIERSRIVGALGFDITTNEFYATSDNRRWSVIKASVTYYKGEPGDEVVLLVPKNAPSKWAAVENIIKHNPLG
ncbi:MAG: hypothetical protein PHT12_02695 [Patescibacteria group bacterium]|nr:hypothetical protein [Patescibacteria group bacterium]